MNIEQVCTRDVVTVDVDETVHAAARRMRDRHVGALVVTRSLAGRKDIVGLVTDRDLVVQHLAADGAAAGATVEALMSQRVVAVPATASLGEAAAVMREEGVRRVLVAGKDGVLVGIAALDDLFDALSAEIADLTQALHKGLARERSARLTSRHSDPSQDILSLPPQAIAARWRQVTAP